jgi:hypothetical protein
MCHSGHIGHSQANGLSVGIFGNRTFDMRRPSRLGFQFGFVGSFGLSPSGLIYPYMYYYLKFPVPRLNAYLVRSVLLKRAGRFFGGVEISIID